MKSNFVDRFQINYPFWPAYSSDIQARWCFEVQDEDPRTHTLSHTADRLHDSTAAKATVCEQLKLTSSAGVWSAMSSRSLESPATSDADPSTVRSLPSAISDTAPQQRTLTYSTVGVACRPAQWSISLNSTGPCFFSRASSRGTGPVECPL